MTTEKSSWFSKTISRLENEPKQNTEEVLNERRKKIAGLILPDFAIMRIADFCDEAKESYINGCFRSCIFCSALVVEQALKHKLIFTSGDWEETYWKFEISKTKFSDIITRFKEAKIDHSIVDDADWLRQARNEIAAHPMYVGNTFQMKGKGFAMSPDDELIWANKIMFRDLSKLLRFIEPKKREEYENTKLSTKDNQGNIIWESSLKEMIKNKGFDFSNFIFWYGLQGELIEEVAFNAYRKMTNIMNALFLQAPEPQEAAQITPSKL